MMLSLGHHLKSRQETAVTGNSTSEMIVRVSPKVELKELRSDTRTLPRFRAGFRGRSTLDRSQQQPRHRWNREPSAVQWWPAFGAGAKWLIRFSVAFGHTILFIYEYFNHDFYIRWIYQYLKHSTQSTNILTYKSITSKSNKPTHKFQNSFAYLTLCYKYLAWYRVTNLKQSEQQVILSI